MAKASAKIRGRGPDTRVRYEVHRERGAQQLGSAKTPIVEEFYGLDKARLAAFGYALDGATTTGTMFTGTVSIHEVVYAGSVTARRQLIDVIDERLAFRLLNRIVLPHAGDLSVSVDDLQREAKAAIT